MYLLRSGAYVWLIYSFMKLEYVVMNAMIQCNFPYVMF
jgi:hypothetical protein